MDEPPSELITLPGGLARVVWRRSARAGRVSLRIDPREGAVMVTLPLRAGRGAGMALVMSHAGWISDRIAALPEPVAFRNGACVPLGGVEHPIRHVPERRGGVWVEDGAILVTGQGEFLPRRVADFMRGEARRRLGAIVAEKTTMADVRARRVTVKDTTSRWGSCAPDGSLAFSWRLVMTPGFVQDYVAAHEVAHLRHMNHGKRFWALVRTLTPYTETAVPWLRGEGARLLRVG